MRVEFKTWILTSRTFFIWLGKPLTPRKAIEQYKHAGEMSGRSVMVRVGHGGPQVWGTLSTVQSREELRLSQVELRKSKNMPKHISTAKGKEGLDGARLCLPFCHSPSGWLQALSDRVQVAGLSTSSKPLLHFSKQRALLSARPEAGTWELGLARP